MEKIKTHILCSVTFFFFENRTVYEIMWKNIVEWDRPQMTIWRMHIAYWIREATNTHSEYAITIALPQQQWLYERAFVLRYMYVACLVTVKPHGTYNYHLAVRPVLPPVQITIGVTQVKTPCGLNLVTAVLKPGLAYRFAHSGRPC